MDAKITKGLTTPVTCDTCGKQIRQRMKGWIKFKGILSVFLGSDDYNVKYGSKLDNTHYEFYHYFCSFECLQEKLNPVNIDKKGGEKLG